MSKVADIDLDQLWACAPPQALQRTADIARRLVKGSASSIRILSKGCTVFRFEPSIVNAREGVSDVVLTVPIRLACGRDIGELEISGLVTSVDDGGREILVDLASQLASEVELRFEVSQRTRTDDSLNETRARLLAVADRIPGLIFERRKLDAGRSSYTFFGSGKTSLPAVRQMMEDGIAGLAFVHRDDRDAVRDAILGSNLEETDLDLTFRVKDLDRSIRWVRSQSFVRRDVDGTVCWDGLCFDITDLVAVREHAEAAQASRESLLLDLTRNLKGPLRAMIELSMSMRSQDRAANLAADTYTIQTAARSMLDTLDRLPGPARVPERNDIPDSAPPRPDESSSDENSNSQTGARILLADDLDLNRKLIADMLSFEGYVVDCVADGAEAVRAVRQQDYDLILMDMIMPGMDGVAATKAIRAMSKPACNTPIVALTANSGRDQLDGCIDAGMDAALTKPMSMEALTTAVAQWARKAA